MAIRIICYVRTEYNTNIRHKTTRDDNYYLDINRAKQMCCKCRTHSNDEIIDTSGVLIKQCNDPCSPLNVLSS